MPGEDYFVLVIGNNKVCLTLAGRGSRLEPSTDLQLHHQSRGGMPGSGHGSTWQP